MLTVDERPAIRDLAGCEQVGVAARPHQRLERSHAAQPEVPALAEIAVAHHHRHRLDEHLVAAARPPLRGRDAPGVAVRHHHPLAEVRHIPTHRPLGGGEARRARPLAPPAAAGAHRHSRHRRAERRLGDRRVGGGTPRGRGGEAHVVRHRAVVHRGVVVGGVVWGGVVWGGLLRHRVPIVRVNCGRRTESGSGSGSGSGHRHARRVLVLRRGRDGQQRRCGGGREQDRLHGELRRNR